MPVAEVLLFFAGRPGRPVDGQLLDIQKLAMFKEWRGSKDESERRQLVKLIEKMFSIPAFATSREVAKHFGYKWFFQQIKFQVALDQLKEKGVLINPVSIVFGLSPAFLRDMGVLDQFLNSEETGEEIWRWVGGQIALKYSVDLHKRIYGSPSGGSDAQ